MPTFGVCFDTKVMLSEEISDKPVNPVFCMLLRIENFMHIGLPRPAPSTKSYLALKIPKKFGWKISRRVYEKLSLKFQF